jgi:hypothetical protein
MNKAIAVSRDLSIEQSEEVKKIGMVDHEQP